MYYQRSLCAYSKAIPPDSPAGFLLSLQPDIQQETVEWIDSILA